MYGGGKFMPQPCKHLYEVCDFVIKINYLDTGLTPQKRTTIHTRSIKLKNIIIFYNTHPAMQPKAKMHMNIFQVLQHTYMQ